MTAKIIPFPIKRVVSKPAADPQIKQALEDIKIKQFVEKLTEELSMDILAVLQENVVDIKSDNFIRDIAMVIESIKSLLYRDFNKKHKYQDITDVITNIMTTQTGQKVTNINYDKIKKSKEPKVEFEPDFSLD
jgi:hypothetical protein